LGLLQAMPPPAGVTAMRTIQTESASPIFETSRRRSYAIVVGVLLVIGYFCSAAVLIRDYSTRSPRVEQVA
jgi:hypothetical protein